ncbi:hypothetical protein VE00_08800 [Pseudogymnoascus sp. WSF 3629]|nr:hypothetical protein VE00_08800 [Pseudogymnoascus sp. WSF 3629]
MSQLDSNGEGFTLAEVNSQDAPRAAQGGGAPALSLGNVLELTDILVQLKAHSSLQFEPSIEASLAKMAEALVDQAKEGSSRWLATRATTEDIEARLTQFKRSI